MSRIIERFKKSRLLGCFNGTGVGSTNYKEHLYGMEWISVKNGLPNFEGLILTTDGFSCQLAVFIGNKFVLKDKNLFPEEIRHWIRLPEIPHE